MSVSLLETNDLHANEFAFFACAGRPDLGAARFSMQINALRAEPHLCAISQHFGARLSVVVDLPHFAWDAVAAPTCVAARFSLPMYPQRSDRLL
jgi:hypothetical protein